MTQISDQVAAALQASRSTAAFTATRYPFTYAYDFYRSHPEHFGETDGSRLSRAEAAQRVREYAERTGQPQDVVVIALADGYLAEWGIEATNAQKAEALDRALALDED